MEYKYQKTVLLNSTNNIVKNISRKKGTTITTTKQPSKSTTTKKNSPSIIHFIFHYYELLFFIIFNFIFYSHVKSEFSTLTPFKYKLTHTHTKRINKKKVTNIYSLPTKNHSFCLRVPS